jgi:predicted GIY-YIG superfamily endonuclease
VPVGLLLEDALTHAHDGTTALYRLYDSAGQLLYLGLSNAPERRWEEHARSKFWWHLVARKTVTWHQDRETAERLEAEGISAEKPLHDLAWRIPKGNRVPRPVDPFYQPLLARIRAGLDDGTYTDGHAFRDDWDTASAFGVSVVTLRHVLSTLVQDFRMRSYSPKDRSRVWTYVVDEWRPDTHPSQRKRGERPVKSVGASIHARPASRGVGTCTYSEVVRWS